MLCTCFGWYVFYVEHNLAAIRAQPIDKLRRGYHLIVLCGYRDACAEEQVFLFQQFHRLHGTFKHALPAAFVGSHSCSLNADDGHHVQVLAKELNI